MRITPERSRAIFGNPSAPTQIWEEQFDGNNADLRRLVKQDWRTVTGNEIWCYLYDLAYVELQPNLFQYLFPLCLNFWYDTLMRNEGAETGIDFHYAIHQGKILDKMLTPDQREAVLHFFYDGFIDRIEAERKFVYDGTNTPAYGWLERFNCLGYIAPVISPIWLAWWELDSPGKAVSAIMYASGLVYLQGENPIFAAWTPDGGGGGPYLTESDTSIFDVAWLPENTDFLANTLSVAYVQEKLDAAAEALQGELEYPMAAQIAAEAKHREEIISIRIDDLLDGLRTPYNGSSWEG